MNKKKIQERSEEIAVDMMIQLGLAHHQGDGVEENHEEAFKWWMEAAKREHAVGQFYVAVCYENGVGIEVNIEEAFKYYQLSAEQLNHPQSQYRLGLLYEEGRGTSKDVKEACKWYQLAAEQGFVEAQRRIEAINKPALSKC